MIERNCSTQVRSKKVFCETDQIECRKEKSSTGGNPNRLAIICPVSRQLIAYTEESACTKV